MSSRNVSFQNASGEQLSGKLELPDSGTPRALALFAHCFTCGKNVKAATNISKALIDSGIGVLRFDFTGLGQSEGEFADTSFSSNVDDLLCAASYLAEHHETPAILVGHSLGGTAVLQAASQLPDVKVVATIGSPSTPTHVSHLFSEGLNQIEKEGQAEVNLGGRPFTIKKQFVDDLEQHKLPQSIRNLRKALLIFHSPVDDTVSVDNAGELFSHALHPKSFVSLDNANHLLTDNNDSQYVGYVLAAWARRYLPQSESAPLPKAVKNAAVARTPGDSFTTQINASGHPLIADEPADVGGSNQGPTPYDLLNAALATCTSMTLKMYAAFKKLPLESVTTTATHARVHADDCGGCEDKDAKIDQFTRTIVIEGELTDEQRQRMLEIADRCPVHKTLESSSHIVTKLDS